MQGVHTDEPADRILISAPRFTNGGPCGPSVISTISTLGKLATLGNESGNRPFAQGGESSGVFVSVDFGDDAGNLNSAEDVKTVTIALDSGAVDHVINLDEEAKDGFGDHVMEFDDFDLEVRGELIGEEAQRMGGFGSFDDLLALVDSLSTISTGDLTELGWDATFDPTELDLGLDVENLDEVFDATALANALGAFGG